MVDALRQIEGAYSLVAMTQKKLIGVRDPMGVRPLVLGRLGDSHILASETCALDIIGADFIRDVEPGEIIVIDADGVQQVRRKEVDVNFDGKIDLVRKMDEKGELIEERLDVDFDGRIDLVVTFQKGVIVKKSYDTNFDDTADMWRYFEGGQIAREEADLDYDGKVDFWEYYEGGVLDRTGVDRDGDGNVDEWQSRESGT